MNIKLLMRTGLVLAAMALSHVAVPAAVAQTRELVVAQGIDTSGFDPHAHTTAAIEAIQIGRSRIKPKVAVLKPLSSATAANRTSSFGPNSSLESVYPISTNGNLRPQRAAHRSHAALSPPEPAQTPPPASNSSVSGQPTPLPITMGEGATFVHPARQTSTATVRAVPFPPRTFVPSHPNLSAPQHKNTPSPA